MDIKRKVAEALSQDRDFWFNDFEDLLDNYDLDISQFIDENGRVTDRVALSEYIIDNIDYPLSDIAEKYGIYMENKNIKKSLKITESDLHNIVEESVNILLKEYGDNFWNRLRMADAAKRAVNRGDDSVYHNALNSLVKRGSTKDEMGQFQNRFEKSPIEDATSFDEDFEDLNQGPINDVAESKQTVRLNHQQFMRMLKESVINALKTLKK